MLIKTFKDYKYNICHVMRNGETETSLIRMMAMMMMLMNAAHKIGNRLFSSPLLLLSCILLLRKKKVSLCHLTKPNHHFFISPFIAPSCLVV